MSQKQFKDLKSAETRGALPKDERLAYPPMVSVVIPVRNEERRIERCLKQVIEQTYPHDHLEVLVADGMSTDGTRGIVAEIAAKAMKERGLAVYLVDNPGFRPQPGMNAGIRAARGDVIVRIDARTIAPPDYVERCVRTLIETGADNVGGLQTPNAESVTQEAIGLAITHRFGVGNAQFRIGTHNGYVDTVWLGCFRRDIFDRVGMFDETSFAISEDSDINQRIRAAGGKVYLDTSIGGRYLPRETFRGFWAQYFLYGLVRAGNILKHKKLTSWRQVIPQGFVVGLATLALLAPWSWVARRILELAVAIYVAADCAVAAWLVAKRKRPGLFLRLLIAFPCMHFAYALGFFRRFTIWAEPGQHWEED